jgi:Ca2+-binding EF-hand superfamily protein
MSTALTIMLCIDCSPCQDLQVSKIEFVVFMLSELGLCESDDVQNILKMFNSLDRTGDGTLNVKDMATTVSEQPVASNTN